MKAANDILGKGPEWLGNRVNVLVDNFTTATVLPLC